jgi:hypothetical protein
MFPFMETAVLLSVSIANHYEITDITSPGTLPITVLAYEMVRGLYPVPAP